MITEDDIRAMVRTMHHGGCDNRDIARAAARCAATLYREAGKPAQRAETLLIRLRAEGWFE